VGLPTPLFCDLRTAYLRFSSTLGWLKSLVAGVERSNEVKIRRVAIQVATQSFASPLALRRIQTAAADGVADAAFADVPKRWFLQRRR